MKNVDTVNDLVLSHNGTLTCIKSRVKLQGRPAFVIASVQHYSSGSSINMSEERRAQELNTATVYISQTCSSCYKVQGTHKLGVVGNTIAYTFCCKFPQAC